MPSDVKPEEIQAALAERQRRLDLDEDGGGEQADLPPILDDEEAGRNWSGALGRGSVVSDPGGGWRSEVRPAIFGAVVTLIAGLLVWAAVSLMSGPEEVGEVPTIQAQDGPERVEPESPGGLQVDHQDVTVLNQVEPSLAEPQVERLLPPPEPIMAAPEADPMVPATPGAEVATQAAPLTAQPVPAEVVAPEPAVTAPAAPETTTATGTQGIASPFVLQFASLRSPDKARAFWAQLQAAHPNLLGDMSLGVSQANVGDQGIFYRVQAGPIPNQATGIDMCAQLKARGQDCIVVRQ